MGIRKPADKPHHAFFWQGLLILLPLIVLTTAGIWSLRGQRKAVEQKAREDATAHSHQLAAQLAEKITDTLASAHTPVPLNGPSAFLYPLNPEPPQDLTAYQKYTEAIDDPAEFDKILTEHPDAISAAGIPLPVLIRYQQYLLAAEPKSPAARLNLETTAAMIHPSILSEPILTEIKSSYLEAWHEHEKIRTTLRQNLPALRESPQSRWVTNDDGTPWRLEVIGNSVTTLPLPWLLPNSAPPKGEEYLTYTASYDGQPLWETPTSIEFTSATDGAITVTAHLTNPQKLYAQHNRQLRWFIGIIVASATTALIGLWVTRRAYLKQQAVNRMKSNFVSSVSHELRAPIASIRLMAERLRSGKVEEKSKRSEYFGFIEQESRRLATLVENVLDFSRIEDGKKTYRFEATDIEQLVTDTVQLMVPHASEKNITIATDLDPPKTDPTIDPQEIQQALINLVDNAIKYSPEKEIITVGLSSKPEKLHLWVQDHGTGIAREEQQKIFQRFYRIGSELERETQGVGIGLAIVRHTAEAHGGSITIDSTPGKGSRFTLELPIKQ